MAPRKRSKNRKYNYVHKEIHRNLLVNLFPHRFITQTEAFRQTMSILESSVLDTSDAEKLVKYIREKNGINNAQRIFNDSPVAERSFPIEIQPIQEKAKAVTPLKHSTKEGNHLAMFSKSPISRVNLKRISSQRKSIGKSIFLKDFEKASGGGESFHPAAFSTPISMATSEAPNISEISRITHEEEIPETQEPNEVSKTANSFNDYFEKFAEDNHVTVLDTGMRYSVDPASSIHQQEETLKNNNQVDEANDSVTSFNNGDGTKQDKAKSWKSKSCLVTIRSKRIHSALSLRMPLNDDGTSVVQQNVLEKPSDSDTRSESEDDERNVAQNNQNTKNKNAAKRSTSVERNTKQINIKSPNRLNNSSLRKLSNENVKQTVQQAVFEEPSYSNLNPGIKSANDFNMGDKNSDRKTTDQTTSNIEDNSRRSRVKTQNLTASAQVPSAEQIKQTKGDSGKENSQSSIISAKCLQETPVIAHSKEETRKTLNFSSNPRNEKVSNKFSQRLQSINSCVGDSNNEGEFTDSTSTVDAVNENTEPVAISRTSVEKKKKNRKAILSDISENTNSMVRRPDETKDNNAKQSQKNKKKYSHGSKSKPMKSSYPPSELNERHRQSSRQRKAPITSYCSGRLGEEEIKTDKIAMNENHLALELFDRLKESFSIKSSTKTPESNEGPHKVVDQQKTVSREDKLFLWLKNLSTHQKLTRNKDVVQMLNSDTIKIGNVEDLMIHEISGVEYAYYLGEDNNYGYMKFHPHSAKRRARAHKFELKFLSLVGSLQMKIDKTLVTFKNGDLVTVEKGVRYCISNPSNDPAILLFILHPAT